MGIGACVAGAAGIFAAIPASVGVRALFDRYRLKMLTGRRVMVRTQRLREIHTAMVPPIVIHEQPLLTEGTPGLPDRE